MDDDLYIKQITDAMGESIFVTTQSSIDLYGSLLNSEEATTRPVWSTLENAYPQAFITEQESTEYLRNLEENQTRCNALLALLPDPTSVGAPTKQTQTYRQYIASLPAPQPKPLISKHKAADPVKLAAAQARVLEQQQQRDASSETAAALLAKEKAKYKSKQPSLPAAKQQQKNSTQQKKSLAKAALTVPLKAAKVPTTMKKTTATTTPVLNSKKKVIKRVSKLEKLRPKPLTVAEPCIRSVEKKQREGLPTEPLAAVPVPVPVPRTAEKKDEKKAFKIENTGLCKDTKIPTVEDMLEEMLTRHKDVVLIEPFINQELDYLLDNNGTDLAAVKITEKLPVPKIAGTKDEQKAGKHEDMVPKNPKTPTTKAMLKEMLTRHRNVVLVEPLGNMEVKDLLLDNATTTAAVEIMKKAPVPGTDEKKDEEKTVEKVANKDPKTPTAQAMLKEMLTRHKDVVLVEPFVAMELKNVVPDNGAALGAVKITKKELQALPSSVGKNSSKRKEREENHSEAENKPQKLKFTQNPQQKQLNKEEKVAPVHLVSPTKRQKSSHPQTAAASNAAPVASAAPSVILPTDVLASLDALTTPFAVLYALLDTVGTTALTLPSSAPSPSKNSTGCGAGAPTTTTSMQSKLAQARATAHRMSRLSTEKRNSSTTHPGKDNHVSIMFEMTGGIAVLEAAMMMEQEENLAEMHRNSSKTPPVSRTNNKTTNTTAINNKPTSCSTATAASAAAKAAAVVSVYDQAAALLETCTTRGTSAQGPELTLGLLQVFTHRTAACARIRAALLKMKHQGGGSASAAAGSDDSWKGMHYNKKTKNTSPPSTFSSSTAPFSSISLVEAMHVLGSTSTKVDFLQELASKESNQAAMRAVLALRLMTGEVMHTQPARLWALIDACKASIMKI